MRLPAPSPTGVGLHAGSSDRALVCAILLRCTWGRQCFALRTGGGSKGPWRKRLSPSTALPPILGASTTSTAMSGNGLRIVGTKRMSETRATARREPMEIAAFAFCAALPGTTIRIPFVRPDATWHRSATGSTTSVFVLPENCDWSMRSAVPGPVGQYCRVWDLARTQTHAGAGVVRFWGGADATAVRPLWGIMTQIRLLARSPGLLLVARHAGLRTVCVLGW
jgi:hypothetical protein